MASVLSRKHNEISSLPENLLLEIFQYLPVKELCTIGRVCRMWRRVIGDNSLWRHVDLRPYRLNLRKMWKVIRSHFSDALCSLHLRGYMAPDVTNWNKPSLSDAMLKELQERCPNLREFGLIELNMTNISAANLPAKLHHLTIRESLVPSGWFKPIVAQDLMCELCYLDLSNSTKTSNTDLKDLCSKEKIQSLKLGGCYRVTEEGLKVVAETLKDLRVLDISGTHCTDLALHHISRNLTKVTHLDMSRCRKVTDGGVATVAAVMKQLEILKLNGCCQVTDGALQAVAENLKCLTVLEISETGCTDVGLRHICCNLSHLVRLDLTGCNKVTNAQIVHIATSFPELRWLSLKQCVDVSDVSTAALSSLGCLQYLDIRGTKLSQTDAEDVVAGLKQCQVIMDVHTAND